MKAVECLSKVGKSMYLIETNEFNMFGLFQSYSTKTRCKQRKDYQMLPIRTIVKTQFLRTHQPVQQRRLVSAWRPTMSYIAICRGRYSTTFVVESHHMIIFINFHEIEYINWFQTSIHYKTIQIDDNWKSSVVNVIKCVNAQ